MKRKYPSSAFLCIGLVVVIGILGAAAAPIEASSPDGPWVDAVKLLTEMAPEDSSTLISQASSDLQAHCRFGVAGSWGQFSSWDVINTFGVGWYLDFGLNGGNLAAMDGAEYAHMVRISQNRPDDPADVNAPVDCSGVYSYEFLIPLTDLAGGLGPIVAANPGELWMIGNEPDRRVVQDDVCPQQYAQAYHDAYYFIKARDPLAQVAIAGLVEVTPGRLQYLDIVWDTYKQLYGTYMPVDVWNMHIYILSETSNGDAHIALGTDPNLAISFSYDCADPNSYCHAEHDDLSIFAQQVVWMRQWMKDHDQQNKPLIISEFGINLPYDYWGECNATMCPADGCFCDTYGETFHPQRVADFLEGTFDYLTAAVNPELGYPVDGNRLVQQWSWFGLEYSGAGSASNLVNSSDGPYTLTVPGWKYQAYVSQVSALPNLLPTATFAQDSGPGNMTAPVTVTVSVVVHNNGDVALTQPVSVTLYADAQLANPIGSTTLSSAGGCGRSGEVVSIDWPNVSPGSHNYWVKVDSGEDVLELSETDNVLAGSFIANGFQTFLPLTLRLH